MRSSDQTKSKSKSHDIITLWLMNQLIAEKLFTFSEDLRFEMEYQELLFNQVRSKYYYDLAAYSVSKGKELIHMAFEIKTDANYSEAIRQIKFYDPGQRNNWCVCAPFDEIWLNLKNVGIWYVPYDPDNLIQEKIFSPTSFKRYYTPNLKN